MVAAHAAVGGQGSLTSQRVQKRKEAGPGRGEDLDDVKENGGLRKRRKEQ